MNEQKKKHGDCFKNRKLMMIGIIKLQGKTIRHFDNGFVGLFIGGQLVVWILRRVYGFFFSVAFLFRCNSNFKKSLIRS